MAWRVAPTYPPATSTRRSPSSNTAAHPNRRDRMLGPGIGRHRPSVEHLSHGELRMRIPITTTNDEGPTSIEHDGYTEGARRAHLWAWLVPQVAAQAGSIAPPQDPLSPHRLDSLGLGFY